ncbi:MAG: glycoprotein [Frankiales bacterium]|jgi:hypothetical protein|nr:glycoprotein [Frankiales bacterium]
MSHTAPPAPNRRRPGDRRPAELILAVAAIVAALAIGIFAVVALNQPNGRQASKATGDITASVTTNPPGVTATATKPAPTSAAPGASSSGASSAQSPPTAASTPNATMNVPVVVVNNTDVNGLADTAVARLRAGGWTATNGGNFSGDILSTAAYYDPDIAGAQAAAEALQLQFPAIKRVKEKFDGLPAGPIVLVLTTDYS